MGPRSYERGITASSEGSVFRPSASMGPRSYERGIIYLFSVIMDLSRGFNGAAFLRTRNQGMEPWSYGSVIASMGPRSYERGIEL